MKRAAKLITVKNNGPHAVYIGKQGSDPKITGTRIEPGELLVFEDFPYICVAERGESDVSTFCSESQ